jgi:hypothetical protein
VRIQGAAAGTANAHARYRRHGRRPVRRPYNRQPQSGRLPRPILSERPWR